MKLIQANGQPQFGYFDVAPDEINHLDYKNDFIAHKFKQKLRYKKFSFVGIQHQQFTIGFAIADLATLGHGFYYVFDRDTEKNIDLHAITPLSLATQVNEPTTKRQFNCFRHQDLEIFSQQDKTSRKILIKNKKQSLCEASIDLSQRQPLYMCSPTGVRGWTFTHKSMALPIKGYFNFEGVKHEFDPHTLASLDDSCGYLRPETEWFWLSCQTWVDGKTVALNLASGVNESVGNENCLWIDGVLHRLDDVIFERLNRRTWHIYTLNGELDFTVYTSWRRYEKLNLGLIASNFSQWVAVLEGTILKNGQKIDLKAVNAVVEEHYAKW